MKTFIHILIWHVALLSSFGVWLIGTFLTHLFIKQSPNLSYLILAIVVCASGLTIYLATIKLNNQPQAVKIKD